MANLQMASGDQIIDKQNPKARLATQILDVFTKVWCIKRDKDDLDFECENCPFNNADKFCQVKKFWRDLCPEYEGFGSMTH